MERALNIVGFSLMVIVFGGMGLMKATNKPAERLALAPDLASLARVPTGERMRISGRIVAIEGNKVKIEDSSGAANATVKPDVLSHLRVDRWAYLSCAVGPSSGAAITLDC